MKKLLTAEITEVANGVLMTIEAPPEASAGDPLGQRSGFQVPATYYESFEKAVAAIPAVVDAQLDAIAVREARKALRA